MQWFSLFVLYALVLIFVSVEPVKSFLFKKKNKLPGNNIQSKTSAIKYLTRFGYNPCESLSGAKSNNRNRLPCQSNFESMLGQFQTKFNLPVTKKLDTTTLKMMNIPRCGMPDSPLPFVNSSNLWSANRTLTWKLDGNPFAFGSLETREHIEQAFNDWANHTGLTFRELIGQGKPDFNLAFVSDDHGDGHPLDGALSHAFYPWIIGNRGQIHLNKNKEWSNTYDQTGINVRLVASHAIGHSLGLTHSYVTNTLMNSLYQVIQPNDMLPAEDQNRIRSLYQKKSISSLLTGFQPTSTTKSATSKNDQELKTNADKENPTMSRNPTGNAELNSLLAKFQANSAMTGLHIHGSQIEDDTVGKLADAIRWKLNFHTISLDGDDSEESTVGKLADVIRGKSSIRTIRLVLSNKGETAVAKLADAIRWNSNIHSIHFAINNLSANAVAKLADVIRWNSNIHNISLALNNLGDNAVEKLVDVLRWRSKMHTINLAASNLTDNAIGKLADLLRWNTDLHTINLAISHLTDNAVGKLADVIRWNTNIRNISLAISSIGDNAVEKLVNPLRWNTNFHMINLALDNLTDNAVEKLVDVIRWNSKLHNISLAISNLQDKAVAKLADVIRWKLGNDTILAISNLGDDAVGKLADALRWNSMLRINLAVSDLSDKAVAKLAYVLRWKSDVHTINLAVDNLNDNAVAKLTDVIRWNSNKNNISLAINNIGGNAARKLADATRSNSNIKIRNVKENRIETYGSGLIGLFSVNQNENTINWNKNQKSSSTSIKSSTNTIGFFNRYSFHGLSNIYNFPMNYYNWMPYLDSHSYII